jgi:magnesium transporter
LDEFQILDSLQHGHLPKFEQSDSHKFLILRAFTSSIKKGSTTINQLSNKIAFFLPLTFIVGVYGMNFHHMPELSLTYGYYIILVGMAVVSLVIYVWFKRNKIL